MPTRWEELYVALASPTTHFDSCFERKQGLALPVTDRYALCCTACLWDRCCIGDNAVIKTAAAISPTALPSPPSAGPPQPHPWPGRSPKSAGTAPRCPTAHRSPTALESKTATPPPRWQTCALHNSSAL